ncbi:MAG: ABC transporter permease [Chloroflexi bacterium]|nr:ABC transporter permease [Chloroflexota bacterium]
MQASSIWQKELLENCSNKKSLIIKLLFPLLLGWPLLLSSAPLQAKAGVVSLLVVFIGVFGSGVGLSKDRTDGVLRRIVATPLSSRRIIVEQVLVNSAIELIQVSPLLALLVLQRGGTWWLLSLAVSLLASILVANVVGVLVASIATSAGQVHLYSALIVFPLLALSGVFMPVASANLAQRIFARLLPFSYLQQSLMAVLGETSTLALSETVLWGSVTALAFLSLAYLAAGRLLRIDE